MKINKTIKQEIPPKLKSVKSQIAKTCLFVGQDHKQGMNQSGWPHAEQHRKTKTAHSEQIDHQVDPKGLGQSHLSEDARGGMNRAMMIRKMSPQVMKTITDVLLS